MALSASLLGHLATARAAAPTDIETFRGKIETCVHFSGEEPYDAQRRREIERGIKESCGGLKAQAKRLKLKYAGQPGPLKQIESAIADYMEAFDYWR